MTTASLRRLGPSHPQSYTADWCVAVWPYGADVWICDTENDDGSVVVVRRDNDDDDDDVILWEGHVNDLPDASVFTAVQPAMSAEPTLTASPDIDAILAAIAKAHLLIEDVHTVHGVDRRDFSNVGHCSIASALRAAFEVGRSAGITEAAAKIGR